MNKILFAMAALFASATMIFAQNNLVATLQHEGIFTHYYGSGALTSAYDAATKGDIITLSPGTFTSPGTINKGITLRGTGINAAGKSYVSGHVTFCSTDSSWVTTIEGVRFSDRCIFQNNANWGNNGQGEIMLIKTFFQKGVAFNNASSYSDIKGPKVRMYNCHVGGNFFFGALTNPDVFIYNSNISDPYSDSYFTETPSAFVNCLIYYDVNSNNLGATKNLNFFVLCG